jgi:hypothetical protein
MNWAVNHLKYGPDRLVAFDWLMEASHISKERRDTSLFKNNSIKLDEDKHKYSSMQSWMLTKENSQEE